jgi:L-lysine exporter family protein LysE/ArgO
MSYAMQAPPIGPFSDGFLLSLSLCLDIGIVNMAILTMVLSRGFRQGVLLGLGSCFGDLCYAVLALLGMTALLQFESVKWVVWIGGSAVLLTFAYRTAREGLRPAHALAADVATSADMPGRAAPSAGGDPQRTGLRTELRPHSPTRWRTFARGFLLAVSSPTAMLWFAAAGGALIAKSGAANPVAAPVFLSGFFLGGVIWTLGLCWVASHGSKRLGQGMMLRACHLASAVLFAYFACSVIVGGYQDLLHHGEHVMPGEPHLD